MDGWVMNYADEIIQLVRNYDIRKEVDGKDYVVRKLKNTFRYLQRNEQKLTMAVFVVLELNRTQRITHSDLMKKVICLTNLKENDVFERLPKYMADYLAIGA